MNLMKSSHREVSIETSVPSVSFELLDRGKVDSICMYGVPTPYSKTRSTHSLSQIKVTYLFYNIKNSGLYAVCLNFSTQISTDFNRFKILE